MGGGIGGGAFKNTKGARFHEKMNQESLGFLIEYADSYEEAKNHGHEDGDSFPLEIGESAILRGLQSEIRQNIEK